MESDFCIFYSPPKQITIDSHWHAIEFVLKYIISTKNLTSYSRTFNSQIWHFVAECKWFYFEFCQVNYYVLQSMVLFRKLSISYKEYSLCVHNVPLYWMYFFLCNLELFASILILCVCLTNNFVVYRWLYVFPHKFFYTHISFITTFLMYSKHVFILNTLRIAKWIF